MKSHFLRTLLLVFGFFSASIISIGAEAASIPISNFRPGSYLSTYEGAQYILQSNGTIRIFYSLKDSKKVFDIEAEYVNITKEQTVGIITQTYLNYRITTINQLGSDYVNWYRIGDAFTCLQESPSSERGSRFGCHVGPIRPRYRFIETSPYLGYSVLANEIYRISRPVFDAAIIKVNSDFKVPHRDREVRPGQTITWQYGVKHYDLPKDPYIVDIGFQVAGVGVYGGALRAALRIWDPTTLQQVNQSVVANTFSRPYYSGLFGLDSSYGAGVFSGPPIADISALYGTKVSNVMSWEMTLTNVGNRVIRISDAAALILVAGDTP